MAGKPKTDPNKPDKRGGARDGSGRKRIIKSLSQKTKRQIEKAAKELAAEHGGEDLVKVTLRRLYDPDTPPMVCATIFRSYLDSLVAKETESKVEANVQTHGPVIGLPPKRGDDV